MAAEGSSLPYNFLTCGLSSAALPRIIGLRLFQVSTGLTGGVITKQHLFDRIQGYHRQGRASRVSLLIERDVVSVMGEVQIVLGSWSGHFASKALALCSI